MAMTGYRQTHKRFALDTNHTDMWEMIKLLRKNLIDNDPLMPRAERQWFTSGYEVWIRLDCLDNPIVTWLMLQTRHSRD